LTWHAEVIHYTVGLGFGFWDGVREKEFALGWGWKRGVGTKDRKGKGNAQAYGIGKGLGGHTQRGKKNPQLAHRYSIIYQSRKC
jgi:hypothetical protein